MKLNVFRNLWGISSSTNKWKTILPNLKNLGYDGVEVSLSDISSYGGIDEFLSAQNSLESNDLSCSKEKMKLIIGVYTGWIDYEGTWDEGNRSINVNWHKINC